MGGASRGRVVSTAIPAIHLEQCSAWAWAARCAALLACVPAPLLPHTPTPKHPHTPTPTQATVSSPARSVPVPTHLRDRIQLCPQLQHALLRRQARRPLDAQVLGGLHRGAWEEWQWWEVAWECRRNKKRLA